MVSHCISPSVALDASLRRAGPTTQDCTCPLPITASGGAARHHVLRALQAQIPDHAGVRAGGGAGGEHSGTGVALQAGPQTNHAQELFGILRPGETDRVGREQIIHPPRRPDPCRRYRDPKSSNSIRPQANVAGSSTAQLHRAERDRDRGRNVRAGQRTIVHTDAGWRIHGKYQRKIA